MREIIEQCKCGVFFTANEHRDYYEEPEKFLIDQRADKNDIPKEVWDEMIKRNTILQLQFYPNTPISFYIIWHYDYNLLIQQAKEILRKDSHQ